MKRITFLIFILYIMVSCKSSHSKTELLAENKTLKERLNKLETYDSLNAEAALELKNMNVVYRGVSNPIYISKSDAISFEAVAPGLRKVDNLGNYVLSPQTGKTVNIKIKSQLRNGDSLTEIKTLNIEDIKAPIGLINGIGCGNKCEVLLKKTNLQNSDINSTLDNYWLDSRVRVKSFKIKFPDKDAIKILGSKVKIDNYDINQLSADDKVYIFDIKIYFIGINNYRLKGVTPIIIRIVE